MNLITVLTLAFAYLASASIAQEIIEINEVIPDEIDAAFMANFTRRTIGSRIKFGIRAAQGQFPFAAWLNILVNGGIVSCGGTLITQNFILSAAHCVDMNFNGINVYMGSIDRNAFPFRNSANGYAKHESYNSRSLENDVSLVRMSANSPYKTAVLPSRSMTSINYEGGTVNAIGWGTTERGSLSQFLLYDNEIGQPLSRCYAANNNFICTKGVGSMETGPGDSGGPLIGDGRLVGIVSYGVNGYDGFARVDRYLGWIQSYTGVQIQ